MTRLEAVTGDITAQAVDALIYRGKKLLSDCVRVRLTTQGQNP